MQIYRILTSLLLCISITLPQYTHAVSFCATSPEGKIYVDDCNYSSNEECKRASGSQGDCVASDEEVIPAAKAAPYCMVTWSTSCKYYDYDACTQAAGKLRGFCYANPEYKNPDKQ
ncbi:MAG: hypothetical protein A2V79_04375 [Betaproteobacteria bacterium RBG_16_56_24]|nr:MAG: hypothetical protein A2V79_04375 [Betaproteobacteria bacterium RBG_16_56_24]